MRTQFWLSATLFHVVMTFAAFLLVRRAHRRLDGPRPAGALLPLLADGVLYGVVAILLAPVLCAVIGPPSSFAALRLLAQALFGQTLIACALLGGLHWRRRRPAAATAFTAATAALLALYWQAYHREPRDLQVSRHTVDLAPRDAGCQLRIVHLSDLQTDRIGAHEERALTEAMAQRPDLIVLTGDYIQSRLVPTRRRATADLKALLARRPLRAPLGVYAVCGDVDSDWPGVLSGTGITTLTGRTARVALPSGPHASIIGLSAPMSRGQDDPGLLRLVAAVPDRDLRIAVGHNPNFVLSLAGRAPVDLALAGHTHGGQVVVPLFGPPITKTLVPRRVAAGGVGELGGMPIHVSRGIGMERGPAPQIRFLCRPEICVLDVRYACDAPSTVSQQTALADAR